MQARVAKNLKLQTAWRKEGKGPRIAKPSCDKELFGSAKPLTGPGSWNPYMGNTIGRCLRCIMANTTDNYVWLGLA